MKFFVKSILLILAGMTFGTALLSLVVSIPFSIIKSLSLGVIMALVFVSTGFFAFLLGGKLKQNRFTFIIIGSSIGRLVLLLAAVSALIRFSYYDEKIIIVSMLCAYFIFQIIEIIGFTKINPKKT